MSYREKVNMLINMTNEGCRLSNFFAFDFCFTNGFNVTITWWHDCFVVETTRIDRPDKLYRSMFIDTIEMYKFISKISEQKPITLKEVI